jgi:hypothetical protein
MVLPFDTPGWILLLSAFFLGFGVDVFPQGIAGNGSTLGTHTASTLLIAFLRPTILRWINPRNDYEPGTFPDTKNYGILWFLAYAVIMIGIHHFMLFFLEDLSLRDFLRTILRVLMSGFFTLVIILLWEGIRFRMPR